MDGIKSGTVLLAQPTDSEWDGVRDELVARAHRQAPLENHFAAQKYGTVLQGVGLVAAGLVIFSFVKQTALSKKVIRLSLGGFAGSAVVGGQLWQHHAAKNDPKKELAAIKAGEHVELLKELLPHLFEKPPLPLTPQQPVTADPQNDASTLEWIRVQNLSDAEVVDECVAAWRTTGEFFHQHSHRVAQVSASEQDRLAAGFDDVLDGIGAHELARLNNIRRSMCRDQIQERLMRQLVSKMPVLLARLQPTGAQLESILRGIPIHSMESALSDEIRPQLIDQVKSYLTNHLTANRSYAASQELMDSIRRYCMLGIDSREWTALCWEAWDEVFAGYSLSQIIGLGWLEQYGLRDRLDAQAADPDQFIQRWGVDWVDATGLENWLFEHIAQILLIAIGERTDCEVAILAIERRRTATRQEREREVVDHAIDGLGRGMLSVSLELPHVSHAQKRRLVEAVPQILRQRQADEFDAIVQVFGLVNRAGLTEEMHQALVSHLKDYLVARLTANPSSDTYGRLHTRGDTVYDGESAAARWEADCTEIWNRAFGNFTLQRFIDNRWLHDSRFVARLQQEAQDPVAFFNHWGTYAFSSLGRSAFGSEIRDELKSQVLRQLRDATQLNAGLLNAADTLCDQIVAESDRSFRRPEQDSEFRVAANDHVQRLLPDLETLRAENIELPTHPRIQWMLVNRMVRAPRQEDPSNNRVLIDRYNLAETLRRYVIQHPFATYYSLGEEITSTALQIVRQSDNDRGTINRAFAPLEMLRRTPLWNAYEAQNGTLQQVSWVVNSLPEISNACCNMANAWRIPKEQFNDDRVLEEFKTLAEAEASFRRASALTRLITFPHADRDTDVRTFTESVTTRVAFEEKLAQVYGAFFLPDLAVKLGISNFEAAAEVNIRDMLQPLPFHMRNQRDNDVTELYNTFARTLDPRWLADKLRDKATMYHNPHNGGLYYRTPPLALDGIRGEDLPPYKKVELFIWMSFYVSQFCNLSSEQR